MAGQSTWVGHGTYLYSPKLSKQMREQAAGSYVFRQFVDKKDGLGAHAGDTVKFTKRLRIDTAGTTLVETTTMPINQIKFVQGSATVNEYGKLICRFFQELFNLVSIGFSFEMTRFA